jgi:alpha-mannosidase
MIGHGHIDPVWLWPWSEGVSIVHSTFRSALDRMKETPDVVFAASSARFYQWVADNDPAMLNEIRQRVKEGRWNVVGGWWVEPDMNLPSGEAMVRQGLYGQRTLQKLIGTRAKVAFNPDAFGHAGTVPQIVRQQGMENYVFMRPGPHEKTIPANLFWWEGVDGSRVLAYRLPISYNLHGDVQGRLVDILKLAPEQPMTDILAFYGVGDHGGGPTKKNIQGINEIKADKDAPTIQHTSLNRYFEVIRSKNLNLPTVKDDLQHHAVGCYSAAGEIKKNNRLSEAALVTAEKISAVGSRMWGAKYPREELTKAWKELLFMQFHDSLPGSSLVAHSQDAREGYNYALHVARSATTMAIQKLEWQVASEDAESEYLLLFNPHAWEINANVEYDLNHKENPTVTDDKGRVLPSQYIQAQSVTGRKRILFNTAIPAMGYRQIRIRKGDLVSQPGVIVGKNSLENEFYRITFSSDGRIGIFDKEVGREVFKGGATGCKGIIIDDPSDTWSHEVVDFTKNTTGSYAYTTKGVIGAFGDATFKILENGPLRGAIRIETSYGDSVMTTDWKLTAGSRKIEANVSLNWNEKLKMLKLSFPVDVAASRATYEVPYGCITRPVNGQEDPGQRWIDVTGQRGDSIYGLTLFNDAKYGYSILDSDMQITATRSAPYAHHGPRKLSELAPDGNYAWQDQGYRRFACC